MEEQSMQEPEEGREPRHRVVQARFALETSQPLHCFVGHPPREFAERPLEIRPFELGGPADAGGRQLLDPVRYEPGEPGQFRVILLERVGREARVC